MYRLVLIISAFLMSCDGGSDRSLHLNEPSQNNNAISDDVFSPSIFDDRLYLSSSDPFCGTSEVPQDVVNIESFVNAQSQIVETDSRTVYSASAANICNSSYDVSNDVFEIQQDQDDISGYFVFSTTADRDKWYWIFILVNDVSVSEQILGSRNLVKIKPGEVSVVPFNVMRNRGEPAVISLLALDADMAFDSFESTNLQYSFRVDDGSTKNSPVSVVPITGIASNTNPYPEVASVIYTGENRIELVFSELEGGERETIDVVALDKRKGVVVNIECGNQGDLVSAIDSGTDSTRIRCSNPSNVDIVNDVVINYRYNLFTTNTQGEYGKFVQAFREE